MYITEGLIAECLARFVAAKINNLLKEITVLKNITSALVVMMSVYMISGCAVPMQRADPILVGSENIKQKNYIIGKPITVTVGEAMVKFQDYWMATSEKSVATIDKNVHIKGGVLDTTLVAEKKYPVAGLISFEGMQYTLVNVSHNMVIMVKPDGTIRDRFGVLYGVNNVVIPYGTLVISSPKAIVTMEVDLHIDARKGYENYELLYTGVGTGNMNLTYREFSREGLARVAFFQNLTYPVSAKKITFKKYKIEVHSATSENITFTVLEDGY